MLGVLMQGENYCDAGFIAGTQLRQSVGFVYLAVRKLLFSCAKVARALNISASTVSKAVNKGQHVLSKCIKIQKEILRV